MPSRTCHYRAQQTEGSQRNAGQVVNEGQKLALQNPSVGMQGESQGIRHQRRIAAHHGDPVVCMATSMSVDMAMSMLSRSVPRKMRRSCPLRRTPIAGYGQRARQQWFRGMRGASPTSTIISLLRGWTLPSGQGQAARWLPLLQRQGIRARLARQRLVFWIVAGLGVPWFATLFY